MMYDKASFLAGLACGLCGRGVGVKTPIAYLYNGVELPKIPDEVMAYPYVIMAYLTNGRETINVFGFDTPPQTVLCENFLTSYEQVRWDSGTQLGASWYSTIPNEWHLSEPSNVADNSLGYNGWKLGDLMIWTNFDVYALDGSVFLAKSEPIPVYE